MNHIPGNAAGLEPVLEKVGRVLADQYGIRVVCQGTRCCTDGKVIYLPSLPDDVPKELMDTIRGYLDHETAHLLAASSFTVGAEFKRKYGAEAFGLLNTLEDLRVEAKMRERYPGSGINLARAYAYAVKVSMERAAAGETLPFIKQLAFAVYSRVLGDSDLPFVEPHINALAGLIDHEIRESVTAPNTRAVAKLAEMAWQTVSSWLNSMPPGQGGSDNQSCPPASPPLGQDQNRSEGKGLEGNGTDRKPGVDSASVPSPNDDAKNPPSATKSGRKRKRKSGDMESNGDSGGNDSTASAATGSPSTSGNAGGGIIGGLGDDIAGAVSRHTVATQAYRVWSTSQDSVAVAPDNSSLSHADRLAPLMPHVTGIRQRLHQTLQAEVRSRWLPDTEEGRLNPKALHRIASVRVLSRQGSVADTEALARRVFRKKVIASRPKTAVTLLVDLSHSMSTRKLDIARDAAMILCESMARLNIPVEVVGFSTQHHGKLLRETAAATGIPAEQLEKQYRFAPLVFEYYKKFKESFRRISGRFASMRTYLMTPLGEALLFAARELAKRPEPRKIILALTDGRPTVGMDSDIATFNHTVDSIRRIERDGIDVCLVGILEACVRDLHHRSVVVDALENLPGAVMTQLQRLLSRNINTTYRHACQGAA